MHLPLPGSPQPDDEQTLLGQFAVDGNLDDVIPGLARDRQAIQRIESLVRTLKTTHELVLGDARAASAITGQSIHLVLTSPPYWTLKRYNDNAAQLGHVVDYEDFIRALDEAWKNC